MFCFNAKQVACAGLLAIGLCIFAAPNAARAEDDPAAMEKAMELLAVSGAKTMFEQMIPRISQQIGILVEQVNPGEGKIVNELLQSKFVPRVLERSHELSELVATVYAKHFTTAELEQLIEFYQTPLGQKLVKEQPQMMTESMGLGQRWG